MERVKENNKINKLKIYKKTSKNKYRLTKKQKVIKIIAGASLLAVFISIPFIDVKITEYNNLQSETAIVQCYGEESIEKQVFDYIMISEQLHSLNLEKFEISDELMNETNIENYLLSPSEITSLIDQFKDKKFFISSKSLEEQHDRIVLILRLINQEKLVNKYIYEEGYNFAHKNITAAAKQYVGEVFGVDPSSIVFDYHAPKNDRGAVVNINIVDENGNTIYTYNVSGWGNKEIKENIIDAVATMDRTDKRFDDDDNDNNLYNGVRNLRIINALKMSSELTAMTNNNDLYNSDLNEDLVGKTK